MTAALVTRAMLSVKFRKIGGFDLTPILSGFLATVVSGGIFVTILWKVLGLPDNVYMYGMWPMVLIVGALNGAITPILYIPAQRLFSKRGMLPSTDQLTSDHSHMTILPERQAKISIEHVNYYHPKATTPSLENINLDVHDGDFLVVTGPAGCGKSTLCMAMVGAVPKCYGGRLEGMVFVDGKATTQMEIPELANHIGVVLADYDTQLVTMTVREEVAFAMENRGYDRETIKARSEEVFAQVGLVGLEDRKITSLSGGQRQRVGIAMALAMDPALLIGDEPTSALDVTTQSQVVMQMLELAKEHNSAIVMVTHNLGVAAYMSDYTIVMKKGRVVDAGTPQDILENPSNEYTKQLKDAVPTLEGGRYID